MNLFIVFFDIAFLILQMKWREENAAFVTAVHKIFMSIYYEWYIWVQHFTTNLHIYCLLFVTFYYSPIYM